MRHPKIFYKERRHRAGSKVCTVALALCFIGLVVAMAHGRTASERKDIPELRAICHSHVAWSARPVQRSIRHSTIDAQASAHLGRAISRSRPAEPI